jgi:hypothetical protein
VGNRKHGHVELPAEEVENLIATLGGAPLPDASPPPGESEKQVRKRLWREAKLIADAERPPATFERFKILMDVADEGRRVVDLADHKARYGLLIVGVLNAIVILVERGSTFDHLPAPVKPWVTAVLAMYAVATFFCALAAINCLRPRRLHYAELLAPAPEAARAAGSYGPRGVLYWESIAAKELEAYRQAWGQVSMGEINAEMVLILHRLGRLIKVKYAALGQLYAGLTALALLAVVIFGVYAIYHVH